MLTIQFPAEIPKLMAAIVEASGVQIAAAGAELTEYCTAAAREAAAHGLAGGDLRRNAIRELLRGGGFKPSGRSKPAQEYLLRTAIEEGQLPAIFNGVDLINAISLRSGLPISLVSLERLGTSLSLRYGGAGERYVFNRAGQELDLSGLICLCAEQGAASIPAGSPVKDSLLAKVTETDRYLAACIYASTDAIGRDELSRWADELAQGFQRWCGAATTEVQIYPNR
jgi:DNA/RNA-binding domain of Phe-tRNA-synthetase-like protein